MGDATADHVAAGTEGSITEVGSKVKTVSYYKSFELARGCAKAEF